MIENGESTSVAKPSTESDQAQLVLDEEKTIGAVARELDLTPSALGNWVRQARADRSQGKTGLTTEERTELARLRKENRELRMERDILKKAAAFFAKHQA